MPLLFVRFNLAHPELADFHPVQRIAGEDFECGRRCHRLRSRWHESGHGLIASQKPGQRSITNSRQRFIENELSDAGLILLIL